MVAQQNNLYTFLVYIYTSNKYSWFFLKVNHVTHMQKYHLNYNELLILFFFESFRNKGL